MTEEIKVLDHGYIRFIEAWGKGDAGVNEAGIIEAARQSTQGSFRGWEQDQKLLGYLFNNKPPHATPFEFAGMIIEVQAPIFVFREWHRHRTQSYNEMSARYAPLPDMNYLPTVERCLMVNSTNKQAGAVKGSELLTHEAAIGWLEMVDEHYKKTEALYQFGLHLGIPKELARIPIPVGRYSRMRASTNLRNWLAFLTLRMDEGAQWEIRQFANAVGTVIAEQFPKTWELFFKKGTVC
jgi:thymidylate synthase (FAD)